MNNFPINNFQEVVDDVLVRHRSILDILTKLQESTGKINRAVTKSATYCGCIKIRGEKQEVPMDTSYSQLKDYMSSHVEGALCDICKEKIEHELATNFFYITALCNVFKINMESVLSNYNEQLKALGKYGLL